MKDVFPEQLATVIDKLNVQKSTLALNLNVSPASVSGWLAGKKNPTLINLINLSKTLNVSLDWLMLGKGPMHLQGPIHLNADEQALVLQLRALPEGTITRFENLLALLTHAGNETFLRNRAQAGKTLHSTQIAMILFDDRYLIHDINADYLRILNLPRDDANRVIGTSFLDWVRSDQRAAVMLKLKQAAEKGQAISLECDHLRYNDKATAHAYLNGSYRRQDESGVFLATAFYKPMTGSHPAN